MVIAKAIIARKPRTRYTVGREAALLPLIRLLPDRLIDRLLAAALRPYLSERNHARFDARGCSPLRGCGPSTPVSTSPCDHAACQGAPWEVDVDVSLAASATST
jgi:hypothetical protein